MEVTGRWVWDAVRRTFPCASFFSAALCMPSATIIMLLPVVFNAQAESVSGIIGERTFITEDPPDWDAEQWLIPVDEGAHRWIVVLMQGRS